LSSYNIFPGFAFTMKTIILLTTLLLSFAGFAQKGYKDSMKLFLQKYVQTHGVVKGDDRSKLSFYDIDKKYRVVARFQASEKSEWMRFETSGKQEQVYRLYGTLTFRLKNKKHQLQVYQSQDLMTKPQYRNYLFLPFTDSTSGNETYVSGRYIDLETTDIKNNTVVLDFNKAYNPYCAYVSGVYNCPIPPKENALPIAIKAGEKVFGGAH
jgi:uncharacterized protein